MRTSILPLMLLTLISCHFLSISASSPKVKVGELCNLLGGWYVAPHQCHSVLDSDPQSCTADLDGLGIIAANLAAKAAKIVAADMQSLLSNASLNLNTNQQKAFETCLELYKNVIPKLRGAAESIKEKKYSAAETVLSAALIVPIDCDATSNDDATLRGYWIDHDDTGFSNVVMVARAVAAYIVQYKG